MNSVARGLHAVGVRTGLRAGLRIAPPIALMLLLGACDQAKPVYVDGAYVRLSPNRDNPSAGYFHDPWRLAGRDAALDRDRCGGAARNA